MIRELPICLPKVTQEHIRSVHVSHSEFISSREGMPGYHFEYTVYGAV